MSEIFERLKEEFPRDAVSWRAQSLTKEGNKAMALAYIDARDVMRRLDDVVGPQNWQDRYEVHGAKTICYLSLRIAGEWVTKADGAGDSDVEAEKGAISDAFKRVAVKWGIGRYLYDMPTVWVACESYESNGKKYWKRWTEDPWKVVKAPAPKPASQLKKAGSWEKLHADLEIDLADTVTLVRLGAVKEFYRDRARNEGWPDEWKTALRDRFASKEKEIMDAIEAAEDDTVDAIKDQFPGARVVGEQHPLMAG